MQSILVKKTIIKSKVALLCGHGLQIRAIGYIPKNSIIPIDENGIIYRLQDYLDDFPEFLKTDITPKLKD